MENSLIGASLKDRDSFSTIRKHTNPKAYSREYQMVMRFIGAYYDRDPSVAFISPQVLIEQIDGAVPNQKHKERFSEMIAEAISLDVSHPNVVELVLAAKRGEIQDKLSLSLANRDGKEDELIAELQAIKNASSLEDALIGDIAILTHENIEDIVNSVVNLEGALKLYPLSLDRRFGSRLSPGHHITTFGESEIGKTALNITISSGFCYQGARGLYLINEDREEDVYFRHVSCMSGMPFDQVKADPRAAIKRAEARGIENLRVVAIDPGNLQIIDALVEKFDPLWVVVDQVMNLDLKGDGLTQVLGRGVRGIRKLAKTAGIIAIDTCQGADSAAGRAVLTKGDVYMSNVEVPAQADGLIGIGASAEQIQMGHRTVTPCKNKLTGDHRPVIIKLDPLTSRCSSVE